MLSSSDPSTAARHTCGTERSEKSFAHSINNRTKTSLRGLTVGSARDSVDEGGADDAAALMFEVHLKY